MALGEFYTYKDGRNNYLFDCPGCGSIHQVHHGGFDMNWKFDGNKEFPTFSPSLLVIYGNGNTKCHSFIKAGRIQFCSDSTHDLAGKTVDIPEWEHKNWNHGDE